MRSHDSSVGNVTPSEAHNQRIDVRFSGMAIIVLFPQNPHQVLSRLSAITHCYVLQLLYILRECGKGYGNSESWLGNWLS